MCVVGIDLSLVILKRSKMNNKGRLNRVYIEVGIVSKNNQLMGF